MSSTTAKRTLSIKARLLIVGVSTMLIVVGLLASLVWRGLAFARESAVDRLLTVVEATSQNVERLIGETRAAAVVFGEGADRVLANPDRCTAWLGRALDLMPEYTNLMLTDRQGRPVCSYAPEVVGVIDYGDRPWLPEVLDGRFTVSKPLIGRRFEVWSLIMAGPVYAPGEPDPVGAVVFAVDLARVQNFTTGITLPVGAIVTVATDSGIVVARSRDPELWVGRHLPPVSDDTLRLTGRATVIRSVSMEGESMLFVRVGLPTVNWRVYAGWGLDEALGPARAEARRSALVSLLLILLTALGIAWVQVPTTRSLARLVADAEAAVGERTPLTPSGPEEIHAVAQRINQTLGVLASAEAEARKLAQVIRQFADPVFIAERTGRIEYVNPAWEAANGIPAAEAVGQAPHTVLSGAPEGTTFATIWQNVLEGIPFRGHIRRLTPDGRTRVDDMMMTPLRDPDGAIMHVVVTSRDITDAETLAERVRETEKLQAVGRLAGGIAHDFNNLLTAISGHAELMEQDLAGGPERARESLEEILKGTRMARSLAHQLLTFSRREVVQAREVSLNTVIERLATFLSRVIPSHVRVHRELDPAAGMVWLDVVHAEQIVMNLAINARDAMPDGGDLILRTRDEPGTAGSPGWTVLEVEDDGEGIVAGLRERIFDPFFTTKAHGTGLGLATVRDIVTRAGGTIEVVDRPGPGALVRVRLPRSAVSAGEVEPGLEGTVTSERHGGTILLAEDDDAVRAFLRRALAGEGYTVVEGTDGADALSRAQRLESGPDLVVTDVMMPHMKGPELVRQLRARWPGMPALLVSGYADGATEHALPSNAELLSKPVALADLLGTVSRLLGRARRGGGTNGAARVSRTAPHGHDRR